MKEYQPIIDIVSDRFSQYDDNHKPKYSFSIVLDWDKGNPSVKLATRAKGSEKFKERMEQAFKFKPMPDLITIHEYEDESDGEERTEFVQQIRLNNKKTAKPVSKKGLSGLGSFEELHNAFLGNLQEIVTEKTNSLELQFDKRKVELEHQKELEDKDRAIAQLNEQIKEKEIEISDLETEIEEAKEGKLSLANFPFGKFLGDTLIRIATAKPALVSALAGIPEEAVSELLKQNTDQPETHQVEMGQMQSAGQPENTRTPIINQIADYLHNLDDNTFQKVLSVLPKMLTEEAVLQAVLVAIGV